MRARGAAYHVAMGGPSRHPMLLRQGGRYLLVGGLQLLLDWLVFVLSTWMGVPAAPGNIAGRISGALLGFWLHGRITFAQAGERRLGWGRFLRYLVVWLALTALSTALVGLVATQLGLQQAWVAKPLVEGALAVVAFFLWRHVVYR